MGDVIAKDPAEESKAANPTAAEVKDEQSQSEPTQEHAEQPEAKEPEPAKENTDRGFPEDVPPDEMTPGQQVAYWRHYSRVHEATAKKLKSELSESQKSAAQKVEESESVQADLIGIRAENAVLKALREHPKLTQEMFDKLCRTNDPKEIGDFATEMDTIIGAAPRSESPAVTAAAESIVKSAASEQSGANPAPTWEQVRDAQMKKYADINKNIKE